MKDSIHESEQYECHKLAENLQDNVIRYDLKCRAIYVSPSMELVGGKGAINLLIGKTPIESLAMPVFDVKEYQSKIENVISTGKTNELDLFVLSPYGEVQQHHIRIVPERLANGELCGALAIGRDITEKKAAEELIQILTHSINASYEQFFIMKTDYPSFLYVNDRAAKTLGFTKEELTNGKSVFDIDPDFNKMHIWEEHVKELEKNGSMFFESKHISKQGRTYPVEIRSSFFKHEGKSYILSIANDITKKKELENALKTHKFELECLAESSPGMMGSFHLKPDGTMCMPYVSPNIFDLFGLQQQDVMDNALCLMKLNHPEDAERVRRTIEESAHALTVWHEEYRILHPLKGLRWMESNTKPVLQPDGGIMWYGYVHDITERKQTEQNIEFLAYYDPLTGIPNRVLAKDRTNQLIAQAKMNKLRIALLYIDLDDFKSINDSLGHTIGDTLLRATSLRLAENTQERDTVSRLGGDEFLMVVTNVSNLDYASLVAKRILEAFEKPVCTGNFNLSNSMLFFFNSFLEKVD